MSTAQAECSVLDVFPKMVFNTDHLCYVVVILHQT